MIRRMGRLAGAVLVFVSVTLASGISPAQAYGGYDRFQTWTLKAGHTDYWSKGYFKGHPVIWCTVTDVRVLVQEMGKHGVMALKAKFEVKGKYSTSWLPSYGSTPWYQSGYFPNDETNYHMTFQVPRGQLVFIQGGVYGIWVKTAGVRYGAPDYTRHFRLNDVATCPDEPSQGGINYGS